MAISEQQAKDIQEQWDREEHLRNEGHEQAIRAAEIKLLDGDLSMAEYKRRRAALPHLQITEAPADELSMRDYKLVRERQQRENIERLPDTLAEYQAKLAKQD